MSIFEIEIASIFSVFAIWFCILYTCLRSLYCMAGCIQKTIEIEIARIFSVFAIWFRIYTCRRSLYCMAGSIQNHRTDGRSDRVGSL